MIISWIRVSFLLSIKYFAHSECFLSETSRANHVGISPVFMHLVINFSLSQNHIAKLSKSELYILISLSIISFFLSDHSLENILSKSS
ncbi:MAG: hypothetical protein WCG25_05590 [bacterium]